MEIDKNDTLYREYLAQPYLKDNIETEFCKEENILARYDEIIESRKVFVSPYQKKMQKLGFPIKNAVKMTYRKVVFHVREYAQAAKRWVGRLFRKQTKVGG